VTGKEAIGMEPRHRWAEILTLGDARFGILVGGPFDGRCYPLPGDATPQILRVPGLEGVGQPRTVTYVLHEGRYRHRPEVGARPAA
jgi:hypothetical protein